MAPDAPKRDSLWWKQLALGIAPALLLALTALWSMRVSVADDEPSASDWHAAAALIASEFRDGELIVAAPSWMDPLLREAMGANISLDMATRMDGKRFSGIWEVSAFGANASERAGLVADTVKQVGKLRVAHYPQTPVQVRYDFVAELAAAKSSGAIASRPRVVVEEVGFEAHRCVQAIPRPDGTLTIEYAKARLGSELVGYVGLADVFTRRDVREPGELVLVIDGEEKAKRRVGVDDGWQRFAAKTPPGEHKVEFRLSALGVGAHDRRLCFAAEARE